jgi:crotonobetainyl-CoA:carnitine CoA-transferase CaiB-like acyl-CoA transferase
MGDLKSGVFADLLVLELASVLAGPSVGMFFAEMGARVVKVENATTGGDVTRTWRLNSEKSEGQSAYFCSVNWGKESIAVDLSTAAGRELVHRLVEKADIVLTSYKTGDAEKLHMDAATLCGLNHRLIYAAIQAYGPEDARAGFDAIIQAEAGFTYMNGYPDGDPLKMPVALMDILAAHQLKEACLIALFRRLQTGKGSVLGSSLISAGIASLANQAANYLVGGQIPRRMGSEHPNIVPYGGSYPTFDGKEVVLAVGSDQQFRRLCKVLGLEELASQEGFARNADRVKNREVVNSLLKEKIAKWNRQELLVALQRESVPAGAVHDMSEVMELPASQNLMLENNGIKGLRTASFSADFPREMGLSAPPGLGQHSRSVLGDLCGFSAEKIEQLLASNVVLADASTR